MRAVYERPGEEDMARRRAGQWVSFPTEGDRMARVTIVEREGEDAEVELLFDEAPAKNGGYHRVLIMTITEFTRFVDAAVSLLASRGAQSVCDSDDPEEQL